MGHPVRGSYYKSLTLIEGNINSSLENRYKNIIFQVVGQARNQLGSGEEFFSWVLVSKWAIMDRKKDKSLGNTKE